MSKRISELPAAATVTGADQLEADQAGTSKRWSVDQVVNYLASLNPFSFTSIQVAGSAQFGGGNITFDAVGNAQFVSLEAISLSSTGGAGVWTIGAAGDATLAGSVEIGGSVNVGTGPIQVGGNSSLNGDGSASFAGGSVLVDNLGNLLALSGNFAFGNIQLNADSSAIFASGGISLNADGSVSFAGGAATINAAGEVVAADYWVGGDAGATQDVSVLTALPSTFTVLHFIGGIFVGTTP